METVWIVLTQLVLLHTVSASSVNIARNKAASLSTKKSGYKASAAVDGKTDADGHTGGKIIDTGEEHDSAWWKVDLERKVQDATVRIYFRTDYKKRRNGVKLYTSKNPFPTSNATSQGQLCHTVTGNLSGIDIPDVYNVTCPGRWRHLILYTETDNDGTGPVLDFGEVEVFVCSDETYGEDCIETSSTRKCVTRTTTCERDGRCPSGCKRGWTGVDCTHVCMNGTYGINCTETCGKCDGVCNRVDGRCPSGCLDGYNGTKCDVPLPDVSTEIPAGGGAAPAVVIVVVIVIAGLTVFIFIVVAVSVWRNGRKGPQDDERRNKQSYCVTDDSVYVNVELEDHTAESKKKPNPTIAPRSSRDDDDDDDDQLEEILDEDEAPTSSPYYNIDEDDVIREVAVEDLAATVQKIKSREGGFEAEYNRLPTGFTATYADSQKAENAVKNKYRGYYPYDYNRVRLSFLPDVPCSDYINASIMHNFNETKTYIGARAPKKKTLGDFWRMIWEQRCGRVVMLTGLVEDCQVKCYQYWPENGMLTTDHFRVTLKETDTRANYTIRTMKVEKMETEESRRVVQYHYTTWPDHGVPDTLALVNFIWIMRRTHTRTDGPLLVHCSAGIGRTGTYIAVDSLLDQAREEGKVDVQGYVSMMRRQRKNMIQTSDQYECVFNCLVEMTKYGNTSLTVDDFTALYTNSGMDARVDSDGKTFRELTQMMLDEGKSDTQVKNRIWVDGNEEFIVRSAPDDVKQLFDFARRCAQLTASTYSNMRNQMSFP